MRQIKMLNFILFLSKYIAGLKLTMLYSEMYYTISNAKAVLGDF